MRLRLLHEKCQSFGPRVLRNYGRTIGKQCVCVLIWESRKARTLLGVSGSGDDSGVELGSISASPDATPLWNSGQCVNSAPAVPDAVRSSATTAPRCVGKHPAKVRTGIFNVSVGRQCSQLKLSSWHWLFAQQPDWEAAQQQSWHQRIGCQYHWYNHTYSQFEDFTARLTSRKRKSRANNRGPMKRARCDMPS